MDTVHQNTVDQKKTTRVKNEKEKYEKTIKNTKNTKNE